MNDVAKTSFDFYYGKEAEQFSFYRVPKILFTDERFKGLSSDAKLLYGLMLGRLSLSINNGWFDDENRAYIYFTHEEVMESLSVCKDKATKLFAELDEKKGVGLIQRKQQGLGKPMMIYVMNFNSGKSVEELEYADNFENVKCPKKQTIDVSEEIGALSPEKQEPIFLKKRSFESSDLGTKENDFNNKNNYNNFNYNNLILSNHKRYKIGENDVMDEIEEREKYKALIADNIKYNFVAKNYSQGAADGILETILDAICSKKQYLLVAGTEIPQAVVTSRFLKLDYSHIEYVLECLKKNTTKVYNIKSYMLTALYNSFSTIDHYYTAEVNHDMYGNI